MKKYIILIFTALLSVSVFAQSENIIKADEAYKNGDYRSAISLYEDVLKTEGFS